MIDLEENMVARLSVAAVQFELRRAGSSQAVIDQVVDYPEPAVEEYGDLIRVIIAAMKEPTTMQLCKGAELHDSVGRAWPLLVEAALFEPVPYAHKRT